MWYPNREQWVVLAIGLLIFVSALSIRQTEPMFLAVVSTLTTVWLLEFVRES
jgi:hypothetical protein